MKEKESWTEIAVFIHGIIPDILPSKHDREYTTLLSLINKSLQNYHKPFFQEKPIFIEWGWNGGSKEKDRFLAEAEMNIALGVRQEVAKTWDWTLNPLRILHNKLRKSFLVGFADMFYYVSEDGKKAVRNNVFNTLVQEIQKRGKQNEQISLTFIAHSAGTVIAHDFLFHLFRKKPTPFKKVNILKTMVEKNQLRVRKFYTLGSPITPMILRADSLISKIYKKQKIETESLGFAPQPEIKNPRWINFWDRDDIISYPVAFLFQPGAVKDIYLDLGDTFPKVHNLYWESKKVAEEIARTF